MSPMMRLAAKRKPLLGDIVGGGYIRGQDQTPGQTTLSEIAAKMFGQMGGMGQTPDTTPGRTSAGEIYRKLMGNMGNTGERPATPLGNQPTGWPGDAVSGAGGGMHPTMPFTQAANYPGINWEGMYPDTYGLMGTMKRRMPIADNSLQRIGADRLSQLSRGGLMYGRGLPRPGRVSSQGYGDIGSDVGPLKKFLQTRLGGAL